MRKAEKRQMTGQLALPYRPVFNLSSLFEPTRLDGLIGQRIHFMRAATELPNSTLELHAGRRSGRRSGRSYYMTPPASIVPTEPAICYLDTNRVRFVPARPTYWWIDEPASCARIDGITTEPLSNRGVLFAAEDEKDVLLQTSKDIE